MNYFILVINTHQPFPVSLCTLQVQELDRHRLGLQSGPDLLIYKSLVDRPKAPLPKKITGREVLGDLPQLTQREHMEVRPYKGKREVLRRNRRGGIAKVREGNPTLGVDLLSIRRRSTLWKLKATGEETSQ